jgi:hypothetical protein
MKKTLLTLFMIILIGLSYNASAQCNITPLILPNGPTTFCTGDSVLLAADSVYVSYLWSTGATSATLNVNAAGSYTVYVTDISGCTGTSVVTVVTVDQGPPLQPALITGSTNVCAGTVQTYSIPSDSTATSYVWSYPSGWSGSSTTTSITTTVGTASGNISVIAINACGVSSLSMLAVTVDSITNSACPIAGNMIVPQGSAQTYSATPVSGATSYTWTLPAGWVGSSTATSITVTVNANSGNICVTANNNCVTSSACCLPVYAYTGNCFALFTLYPDTNILHHYFIIDTLLGVPPLHYDWSWGDLSTDDTIAYPSHIYADSGIYSICLTTTDSNGCQSHFCNYNYHIMRTTNYMVQVDVVHSLPTGIKQPDMANSVSLFPNPNSGNFTLSYSLNNNSNAIFKIMDVTGRKVYSTIISGETGRQIISVNDLSNGIYFYQITNDKETLQGKFVIEK